MAVPLGGEGMLELVEQLAEELAILGEIDVLGIGADDRHARPFSGSASVSGVCPPNWTMTPSGFSVS